MRYAFKYILLVCTLIAVTGCASIVENCHKFQKYVDIKAFDCAPVEVEKADKK